VCSGKWVRTDEVNLVALRLEAHEEVVGLDVAVDEVLRMHVLDAANLQPNVVSTPPHTTRHTTHDTTHAHGMTGVYHLVGDHEHGLDGELAVAHVEDVLERGSEEIDHHHVVVALLPEPSHVRKPDYANPPKKKKME
jgi:hypothetical protein